MATADSTRSYLVWIHEKRDETFTMCFQCWAENEDRAESQAENAYPGCDIVYIELDPIFL